jgi:hypothetical protein
MDIPLTLETGLSLLSLALLPPDRVEGLATIALAEGIDSPRIRELAGGSVVQDGDSREMLAAELTKRGRKPPSPAQAARHMAKAIATEILEKRMDPFEGARYLALISRAARSGGSEFHELDPFVYVDGEAEGRPEDREFFREAIANEAKKWLETGRGSV